MRVIVSAAYGTFGDLAPLLAIAEALQQQDHTVVFVCDAFYVQKVEAMGIPALGVGDADAYAKMLADAEARWRSPLVLIQDWMSRLKPHYQLLERALSVSPKDTVLVGHSMDLAVKLIEEKKGVPCATVVLQPWMLRSKERGAVASFAQGLQVRSWYSRGMKAFAYKVQDAMIDFAYCPQLNAFRRELGLEPVSRVYHKYYMSKTLVLGMFPPWLASSADWPVQLRLVGFPMADQAAGGYTADATAGLEQLPSALSAFVSAAAADAAPLFVFTLGTAPPPYARAFFACAVEASARLGARCVLICAIAALVPAPLPPHAHHAEFAPFSALLQHAAVFSYNGGVGGMSQALRAGVPQLIVPGKFDQLDNCSRMVRLGVAVRLEAERATVARCVQALQAARGAGVRAACAAAAGRFDAAATGGAVHAAALVGGMLGEAPA